MLHSAKMKARVLLLSLFLFVPGPPGPAAQGTARKATPTKLGRKIGKILADPALSRAHWGISVATLNGQPIYSLNEGQLFEPASNAKLFTTAAAFAIFPPDTKFSTRVEARGTLDAQGILHGDLVLVGGGDPSISGRAWPYSERTERPDPPLHVLTQLADQVAQSRQVRSITGRVVGDDTWFPYERYGSGWGWDDLQWEYGAPVSALTVNDNVIYLNIEAGAKAGDPVAIAWDPPVPYYSLENAAVTSTGGSKPQLGVDRQPGSKTVRIYGSLPVGGNGEHLALALEDPAEVAAMAFRQMLQERGIQIAGAAAVNHAPAISTAEFLAETRLPIPMPVTLRPNTERPAGQVLATHESPPISEDLTVVNKASQNLHAELLLHDLGKAVLNDGSTAAGARVIRQFLISAGVISDDVIFYDGSGLSPDDLITPRAATTLLAYAAREPWGAAFRSTLPVAGVDGTLSGRFAQSRVKGKLFAKTGTLAETNSLSGYLEAGSGKTIVLSILCNGHDPSSSAERKAMDRIVEAIYAAE